VVGGQLIRSREKSSSLGGAVPPGRGHKLDATAKSPVSLPAKARLARRSVPAALFQAGSF